LRVSPAGDGNGRTWGVLSSDANAIRVPAAFARLPTACAARGAGRDGAAGRPARVRGGRTAGRERGETDARHVAWGRRNPWSRWGKLYHPPTVSQEKSTSSGAIFLPAPEGDPTAVRHGTPGRRLRITSRPGRSSS